MIATLRLPGETGPGGLGNARPPGVEIFASAALAAATSPDAPEPADVVVPPDDVLVPPEACVELPPPDVELPPPLDPDELDPQAATNRPKANIATTSKPLPSLLLFLIYRPSPRVKPEFCSGAECIQRRHYGAPPVAVNPLFFPDFR